MRAEDICWEYGLYTDTCNCGCCIHQEECSGNEDNEESEDE